MEWLLTIYTFDHLELIVIIFRHSLALETSISVINVLFMAIFNHGGIVFIISKDLKCAPESMITLILQNTSFKNWNLSIGKIATNFSRSDNIMPGNCSLITCLRIFYTLLTC